MARSILRPEIFYYERLNELKHHLLSLYMVMHDRLILLAMLIDKYDVVLNETSPDAYDSTKQFQKGEVQKAQTRLQKTNDNLFTHTKRFYR